MNKKAAQKNRFSRTVIVRHSSTVRRVTLATWSVIGLERVVIRTIGTVAVRAPAHMAVAIGRNRTIGRLGIGDRAANNGRCAKRSQRIPPAIIVTAIAVAIVAITAVAVPMARAVPIVSIIS